jgi:hypothetical protein
MCPFHLAFSSTLASTSLPLALAIPLTPRSPITSSPPPSLSLPPSLRPSLPNSRAQALTIFVHFRTIFAPFSYIFMLGHRPFPIFVHFRTICVHFLARAQALTLLCTNWARCTVTLSNHAPNHEIPHQGAKQQTPGFLPKRSFAECPPGIRRPMQGTFIMEAGTTNFTSVTKPTHCSAWLCREPAGASGSNWLCCVAASRSSFPTTSWYDLCPSANPTPFINPEAQH